MEIKNKIIITWLTLTFIIITVEITSFHGPNSKAKFVYYLSILLGNWKNKIPRKFGAKTNIDR